MYVCLCKGITEKQLIDKYGYRTDMKGSNIYNSTIITNNGQMINYDWFRDNVNYDKAHQRNIFENGLYSKDTHDLCVVYNDQSISTTFDADIRPTPSQLTTLEINADNRN